MLLRMAWRNVWRSRNRSLVIIGSIGVGIWAALSLTAFYNGQTEQRIRSAIENEIAHVQVHHPGFREDYDLSLHLADGPAMLGEIRKIPEVQHATGRIVLQGMASSASGSTGVDIRGVMPEDERQVSRLSTFLDTGSYFSRDGKHEAFIGRKLMEKLKLRPGGKIILTFNDVDGNIASGAFRITGVFKTVNTPFDESQVFIHVRDAGELSGLQGRLNEIAVLLREDKQAAPVAAMINGRWPRESAEPWMDISPEMELLVTSFDSMILVYMLIIMLTLAFGIVNTMMMSVLERTREIGMMISLGMNRLRVFSMITLETLMLVLAGCPGGILATVLTLMATRNSGIDLGRFSDVYSSFGYSSVVYPSLTPPQWYSMIAMVVATALLAALFPARRALNINPAEAIRK
jgi:ABC-type lipoprotein release transport system permease subunit